MGFKVGLSQDLSDGRGGFSWGDIAIGTLDPLSWSFLPETGRNFRPEVLAGVDAVAFAGPGIDADSFPAPEQSPLVIARFGVGYDNIDLDACTRAGTALTITPDGSQKPVATAALTLMLSTLHRLSAKEYAARGHRWDNRLEGLGQGLNGKTVATVGLGNIATEFFRLLNPFDCVRIAHDPWKSPTEAQAIGVTLVDLETLFSTADAIVVLAALTSDTRHLINARTLELMKPSAVIVNISRGPIIDEAALIDALESGAIAGAGLDVFETEPPAADNPLFSMRNVVLTPHNLSWTDELALGMGRSAFGAIKAVSNGLVPEFVVNKDVLTTPQFLDKLGRRSA